jgi:hypothetical protein
VEKGKARTFSPDECNIAAASPDRPPATGR